MRQDNAMITANKQPRPRLCAYGVCQEETVAISINYRGEERPTFCCEEHAIAWLQRRLDLLNRNPNRERVSP